VPSPTDLASGGSDRTRPTTPYTAHLTIRTFPTDVQLQLPIPATVRPPGGPTLHEDAPRPPAPLHVETFTCSSRIAELCGKNRKLENLASTPEACARKKELVDVPLWYLVHWKLQSREVPGLAMKHEDHERGRDLPPCALSTRRASQRGPLDGAPPSASRSLFIFARRPAPPLHWRPPSGVGCPRVPPTAGARGACPTRGVPPPLPAARAAPPAGARARRRGGGGAPAAARPGGGLGASPRGRRGGRARAGTPPRGGPPP